MSKQRDQMTTPSIWPHAHAPHKAHFTLVENPDTSYVLSEYTEMNKDVILVESASDRHIVEVGRTYSGCCFPNAVLDNGEIRMVYTAWIDDKWSVVNTRIRDELLDEEIVPCSHHAFRGRIARIGGSGPLLLVQTESSRMQHFVTLTERSAGGWGHPIVLSDVDTFSARPDISADTDSAIAVWDSYTDLTYHVVGCIINLDRTPSAKPFTISIQDGWNVRPCVTFYDRDSFLVAWINIRDVISGGGIIDQRHCICGAIVDKEGRIRHLGENGRIGDMNHGILSKLQPTIEPFSEYHGRRRHVMLKSDGEGHAYVLWERKKNPGEFTATARGELCALCVNDGSVEPAMSLHRDYLFYEVDKNTPLQGDQLTVGAIVGGPDDTRELSLITVDLKAEYPTLFTADYAEWQNVALPFQDTSQGRRQSFYWGDLHVHSCHSKSDDALGDLDELYHYARDKANLDFICITDNDCYRHNMRESEWLFSRFYADFFDDEGRFIALPGFEWTCPCDRGRINHRSVLMKGDAPTDIPRWTLVGSSVETLHKICKQHGWITHVHHIDRQRYRLADTHSDSNLEAVSSQNVYIEEEPAIYDVLNSGFAGGIIGGSDNHRRNPGLGGALTCIKLDHLSRHTLFEALRSGGCHYVTAGRRVHVTFDCTRNQEGHLQLMAQVASPVDVLEMRIIRNGRVVHGEQVGQKEISLSWIDRQVPPGHHWYILRILLDGPTTEYPGHLSMGKGAFAWAGPLRWNVEAK